MIHGLGPLMDDASDACRCAFSPSENPDLAELWVSFVRWWLARRCGCAMGRVGVDLGAGAISHPSMKPYKLGILVMVSGYSHRDTVSHGRGTPRGGG